MLTAFRNALIIPDLRAKLLVTIGLLASIALWFLFRRQVWILMRYRQAEA